MLALVLAAVAAAGVEASGGAAAEESCLPDLGDVEPETACLKRGSELGQRAQLLQTARLQTSRMTVDVEDDPVVEGPAPAVGAVPGSAASELLLARYVSSGNYQAADLRRDWASYQAGVVRALTPRLSEQERAPLRIIVATYVGNSESVRDNWAENVQKLRENGASDRFDFAFFHYDGSNSLYEAEDWYRHPSVKVRHVGTGCPSMFWRMLDVPMVTQYDYVWLSDGDMNLGFFSWDLYRTVLARLQPMISQPAIVPISAGLRASDVLQLNMRAEARSGGLVIAREANRSEVMTPVLSSRVWPALHRRLSRNNLHTMFFSDSLWDLSALASKAACGRAGIVLVDASPSRHLDWKALLSPTGQSANCTGFVGAFDNDKVIQPDELQLMATGLRGHCDQAEELLAKTPLGSRTSTVQHDLQVATEPHLREWTAAALLEH